MIRDSQDVNLPVSKPSTAKVRDSQDLTLPVSQPSTAKVRDSQDLTLPISQPTTGKIRVSQDLTLVIYPNSTIIVIPGFGVWTLGFDMDPLPAQIFSSSNGTMSSSNTPFSHGYTYKL